MGLFEGELGPFGGGGELRPFEGGLGPFEGGGSWDPLRGGGELGPFGPVPSLVKPCMYHTPHAQLQNLIGANPYIHK